MGLGGCGGSLGTAGDVVAASFVLQSASEEPTAARRFLDDVPFGVEDALRGGGVECCFIRTSIPTKPTTHTHALTHASIKQQQKEKREKWREGKCSADSLLVCNEFASEARSKHRRGEGGPCVVSLLMRRRNEREREGGRNRKKESEVERREHSPPLNGRRKAWSCRSIFLCVFNNEKKRRKEGFLKQ